MKGSSDLLTLVVAVVPMTLILIFSSMYIAERNVTTDLYAEVSYTENKYQSEVALAELMSPGMKHRIGMYPLVDDSTQDRWRDQIEGNVSKVLGAHSSAYSFVANDFIEIEGDRDGNTLETQMYVASPKQEAVKVKSRLGGSR